MKGRRGMKIRYFFLLLSFLSISSYAQIRTVTEATQLWDKAVSLVDRNSDWVPGYMTMKTKELTLKDEVKNTFSIRNRMFPGADGSVQSEMVSFMQNGKDVTEERKNSSQNQNSNQSPMAGFNETPFHPDVQDSVVIKWTGNTESIDGRICLGFTFEFRNKEDELVTGTTWLDERSGAPLKLVILPEKLPRFVESMESTIYYLLTEDDDWYTKKVVVQGSGGFLFVRRKFTMEMDFSDYWRSNGEG